MRIDNPRFKPEDLFGPDYWGEVRPPVDRIEAKPAPKRERKAISRLLGEILLKIIDGSIKGSVLPEGAIYNPSNPDLTGLAQHFPGVVALVDKEYITNLDSTSLYTKDYAKTLPLSEEDELMLHVPSRQFIRDRHGRGSYPSSSGYTQILHNEMTYTRSVRIYATALQARSLIPVIYHPSPFPLYNDGPPVPIWREALSLPTERIGQSYQGWNGGIWRTTRVEICQEGSPAQVPESVAASLGGLATNA